MCKQPLISTSNGASLGSIFGCVCVKSNTYSPPGLCFGHHQFLRELSGLSAAKYYTVLTSCQLWMSAITVPGSGFLIASSLKNYGLMHLKWVRANQKPSQKTEQLAERS